MPSDASALFGRLPTPDTFALIGLNRPTETLVGDRASGANRLCLGYPEKVFSVREEVDLVRNFQTGSRFPPWCNCQIYHWCHHELNQVNAESRNFVPMTYYKSELARIHHEAFGDYADLVAPGVIYRIRDAHAVVELGCGSGSLTRHMLTAGHEVLATDASPAMLELARNEVPEANPSLLVLPGDPIRTSDAVVALGHVFNYLEGSKQFEQGVVAAASAGGVFVTDMLDLSYADSRPDPVEFHHEGEGWKLWTVNRIETPQLVVREMTIETDAGITHEVHRNLLVDSSATASLLKTAGFEVTLSTAFGDETLPPGFVVLEARRPT
jgi:SAM-dependent methyltransferase